MQEILAISMGMKHLGCVRNWARHGGHKQVLMRQDAWPQEFAI